jgi:hypothetical protein
MAYRLVGCVTGTDVEFRLDEGSSVLGASTDCDLLVNHPTVSRRHVQVTPTDQGLHVLDLASKNGTWIGTVRVQERVVGYGESIRLGQVELRVEAWDPTAEPAAEASTPRPPTPSPEYALTKPRPAVTNLHPARNPFECFVTRALRDALDELASGRDLARLAAIVGHGLSACLPLSTVEIGWTTPGANSTLYCRRQDGVEFSSQQITRNRGDLYLYCAFKTIPEVDDLESLLDAALGLVALGEGSPSAGKTV